MNSAKLRAGIEGCHDENVRHRRKHRNRSKVFADVVGHAAVEARVYGEISRGGEHQRVAIWRGLGAERHADVSAGARTVFDDDLRAHLGADLVADDSRERVRGAARRKGNDQPDRLAGIRLRRARDAGRQREGKQQEAE